MLKDIFKAIFVAITTSAINLGVLTIAFAIIEEMKELITKNRAKTHMMIIDVDEIHDEEDTWTIMGQ